MLLIIHTEKHSSSRPILPQDVSSLQISSPLYTNTSQLPALELVTNLLHGHPLDALVAIDPLNQPLVHQQHLRLAAHLRMDGNGEHEAAVFRTLAVEVFELLFPKTLDDVGVDVAVGGGLAEGELEGGPVV